ncbi:hypothetical protein, partial [Comamonas sp.]|uniref:hypothetical protein n=1 Tax=Comamonas sp. TaxID=34028 RepID=UPI00283AB496
DLYIVLTITHIDLTDTALIRGTECTGAVTDLHMAGESIRMVDIDQGAAMGMANAENLRARIHAGSTDCCISENA